MNTSFPSFSLLALFFLATNHKTIHTSSFFIKSIKKSLHLRKSNHNIVLCSAGITEISKLWRSSVLFDLYPYLYGFSCTLANVLCQYFQFHNSTRPDFHSWDPLCCVLWFDSSSFPFYAIGSTRTASSPELLNCWTGTRGYAFQITEVLISSSLGTPPLPL